MWQNSNEQIHIQRKVFYIKILKNLYSYLKIKQNIEST